MIWIKIWLKNHKYSFRKLLLSNYWKYWISHIYPSTCCFISGLSLHTFHGNFFVRSTDLLSLPNVNPDHSFSMQIEIEESLSDHKYAGFQAALLYTTAKGKCIQTVSYQSFIGWVIEQFAVSSFSWAWSCNNWLHPPLERTLN